jgi:hypothetical protein
MAAHAGSEHELVGRVRFRARSRPSLHPVLLEQHVRARDAGWLGRRAAELADLEALQDVHHQQRLNHRSSGLGQQRQEGLRA